MHMRVDELLGSNLEQTFHFLAQLFWVGNIEFWPGLSFATKATHTDWEAIRFDD